MATGLKGKLVTKNNSSFFCHIAQVNQQQIKCITLLSSSVNALSTISDCTGPGHTVLTSIFGKSVSSVRRELKKPCGHHSYNQQHDRHMKDKLLPLNIFVLHGKLTKSSGEKDLICSSKQTDI